MRSTRIELVAVAFLLISASGAVAHDDDLRSGQLKPTVGRISDEVALARLRTAGVDTPSVSRRESGKIVLRGMVEGRSTEIELDDLTGHAVDLGSGRRRLVGPEGIMMRPLVTGTEVPIDHRLIGRPEMMRDAIVPNQ